MFQSASELNIPTTATTPNDKLRHCNLHDEKFQNSAGAATSFFDGSYFCVEGAAQPHNARVGSRPFEYAIPAWRYLYTGSLVALDSAMTLAPAGIFFLLNHDGYVAIQSQPQFGNGTLAFLILNCLCWLASLFFCGAYKRHTMGEGYQLYGTILNAGVANFIVLCMAAYIFNLEVPRSLTVFGSMLSVMFTVVERWLMRRALHRNRRKGECNYQTVVIGSPESLHTIVRQLQSNTSLGYEPIAVCPVETVGDPGDPKCPQRLVSVPFIPINDDEAKLHILTLNSHLPQTAKKLNASTVLISDVVSIESETMRTLALAVESMGLELALTMKVADLRGSTLHLRQNPSMPILTASLPQYSTTKQLLKRVLDIVLSSIALIISSPVMAYVAIRVKTQDGGPAIYKQERIGLYGKPFTLYKFRSMCINADKQDAVLAHASGEAPGILFKVKNDTRVTQFGKFIRKTSLDEFPQFFNVLKGDMSLVGPRPQRQYEIDQYEPLYSARLLVKPGITGPWQISGRSDLSRAESEQLDVSYVENWSLTGDLAILLKTVSAVIQGKGSY